MITIKEAEAIAKQYLVDLQGEIGSPVQITKTQEASFGWVFFYQSKDYIISPCFSTFCSYSFSFSGFSLFRSMLFSILSLERNAPLSC